MYNRIFTKILDSSIWLEDGDTRLVWLTLIAAMDQSGFAAFAAIANLAHRARVPLESARKAVAILESPDGESSDPEHEGRRIERVPGGWMILNSDKYRAIATSEAVREQTRIRVARFRQGKSSVTLGNDPVAAANETVTTADTNTGSDPKAVRTLVGDQVRTVSNTVVSREENSHNGNGFQPRVGERRQGNGANEPNSLPRDHSKHRICGGPLSKLCFSYNQYDSLAARYRGATPSETDAALNTFHAHVLAQIPEDKLAGDMVWLLQHFDAWLVEIGRVASAPTKTKKRKELTQADLDKIVQDIETEKKQRSARR